MIDRGTGALLDPPGQELVGVIPIADDPPPSHEGVQKWMAGVSDQGSHNSCVAHAMANAIYGRSGAEGRRRVMPSRRALWYFARAMRGTQTANDGCSPLDMIAAITAHGYPPEALWPESCPMDRSPDQEAMRESSDAVGVETERVSGDTAQWIKSAIAAEYPVLVTIAADTSYMNNTGVWRPHGVFTGYHAITAVRYNSVGVVTMGSYGRGHGMYGFTMIPWDVVGASDRVRDCWAISTTGRV